MKEYKGKIFAKTPKSFKPIWCPHLCKIKPYQAVCPVCGKPMDETYHGRQYCAECKEKLGDKKYD